MDANILIWWTDFFLPETTLGNRKSTESSSHSIQSSVPAVSTMCIQNRRSAGSNATTGRTQLQRLSLEITMDTRRSFLAQSLNIYMTRLRRLLSHQFHELKFLELSAFLYSPLKWRGGPNRIRLSSYIQALKQAPVEYSIYIRHLAGLSVELPERTTFDQIEKSLLAESHSYVNSVRRQLARPFSQMDDQDLMVQGFAIY